MRKTAYALPVMLSILALPRPASAQEAAADALFDSARTAMARRDFDRACEQFRASDKLDPAAGTEMNLADCEEKRGRLASAWELFRMVEEKLNPSDERVAVAHERAQALQARVPRLTLELATGSPKNSSVRDGSVELGSATFGIPLPVEPGSHELVVSAPGFAPRTFQIQLAEGEARSLVVSPGASGAPGVPPTTPLTVSPSREQPARGGSSGRRLGFVLGGVGVAGLGVATITSLMVASKKSAVDAGCQPDKSCTSSGLAAAHSGRTLEIVSNVGWVVGAAALGAGAYLLLTSGASSKPSTAVALLPSPAGGQLSLSRSW
ncbi:MAG TPA: hypothetical protein VF294_11900 [Polyangiaceae bacterium]